MPWRTSACPSSSPSSMPGQTPAAEPIRPMSAASHPIMRRICRGVAATARSSAISRSRCWIDRPIVLVTTNIAMNSASPANAAVTGIKRDPRRLQLGMLGLAARVAGEHLRAAGGGAQARGVEARDRRARRSRRRVRDGRPAALPRRRSGRSPSAARRRAGDGRRRPPSPCGRARWTRASAVRRAGRDSRPRPRRAPAGATAGGQHVRRQWRAAPSRGRRLPGSPSRTGTDTSPIAARTPGTAASRDVSAELTRARSRERHVVVGADDLLACHDSRRAGVAFDGRMAAQHRLELHAPGRGEHGRGHERDQRAGERARGGRGR